LVEDPDHLEAILASDAGNPGLVLDALSIHIQVRKDLVDVLVGLHHQELTQGEAEIDEGSAHVHPQEDRGALVVICEALLSRVVQVQEQGDHLRNQQERMEHQRDHYLLLQAPGQLCEQEDENEVC